MPGGGTSLGGSRPARLRDYSLRRGDALLRRQELADDPDRWPAVVVQPLVGLLYIVPAICSSRILQVPIGAEGRFSGAMGRGFAGGSCRASGEGLVATRNG
jgi:hypothetical protein